MGDRDLLKPLLERKGVIHFGRVCMKPGKPLTFATLDVEETGRKLLVFGLPGSYLLHSPRTCIASSQHRPRNLGLSQCCAYSYTSSTNPPP